MKKLLIALTIVLLAVATVFAYALFRRGVLKESSQPPVRVAEERRETGYAVPNWDAQVGQAKVFITNAQIVSLDEPKDGVFPDSSVRIKIGYFDDADNLHVYPARIGGMLNNGSRMAVGFCSEDRRPNCWSATPQDVLAGLAKDEIFQIQIVYQVNTDWLAAQQLNKYSDFYTEFKNALSTGDNFPEPPDSNDFVLQVSQVRAD